MTIKTIYKIGFIIFCCVPGVGCKKYLDAKSVQSLSTPQTLEDLQALADNPFLSRSTRLSNSSADEYYISYDDWVNISMEDKDSYVWASNLNAYEDWRDMYNKVFNCNTILDNLANIDRTQNPVKWDAIKGAALFLRAFYFDKVMQLYCLPYDSASASQQQGIPLRLNSDFNAVVDRSSLEATYNQIVKDLKDASGLLPDILPGNMLYKARPTRAACYGMLAKVYLQTSRFQKALESASQSVGLYDYLLDFNDKSVVDSTSASPIQKFNAEVIFYATVASPVNALSFASVDTTIYRSFDSIDLRKPVYFSSRPDGTKFFKGSYNGGSSDLFQGIAVDEMYLIRAECNARLNNADEALNDLNKLLIKRWKKGKYTPYASLSAEQALAIILAERKKELLYRGTRWADLKRLNKEPAKAIVLRRVLQGTEYVLQPNDLRYAFLIPREVITKSSITQNKR